MDMKYARVYPAVVTPFHEDGSFNYEAAKKHIDWMLSEGLTGLGILMASGEYQSMSLEEHKAYVREIVPYIGDRASVIVGCSRERPEDVVELMENAREAGADAAMVLPSFYYRMDQKEIIAHYTYINDHSDLDIMLYNNPIPSSPIAPETFDELCKLEHVRIIKDASCTQDRMMDYTFRAPETMGILCGCDYLCYPGYAAGAIGCINMTANVLPRMMNAFHKAMIEDHDYDRGLELFKKLWPMVNVTERFPKPTQAVKFLLTEAVGIDVGTAVRRPRQELSEEEKRYLLEASHIHELLEETAALAKTGC